MFYNKDVTPTEVDAFTHTDIESHGLCCPLSASCTQKVPHGMSTGSTEDTKKTSSFHRRSFQCHKGIWQFMLYIVPQKLLYFFFFYKYQFKGVVWHLFLLFLCFYIYTVVGWWSQDSFCSSWEHPALRRAVPVFKYSSLQVQCFLVLTVCLASYNMQDEDQIFVKTALNCLKPKVLEVFEFCWALVLTRITITRTL